MIYNFPLIKSLLKFERPGDFYFIQIYMRRKDNPLMDVDMRVIRDFFIYSEEDLMQRADEIIDSCEQHNARAYIRLNRRNTDKIALMMMKRLADLIADGNTRAARNIYASVCGEHNSETEKTWVVDLDGDTDQKFVMAVIEDQWSLDNTDGKLITEVPTPNGKHLIVTPFNLQRFQMSCPNVDVHKDNPTILYAP